MESINGHEVCDRILEHTLSEPDSWHNPVEIRDEFLESVPLPKVKHLFNFMSINQQPEPATFQRNAKYNCWEIKKNEYTEEFLRNGGFTRIYEEHLKELEKKSNLKDLEKQKLELETENLKYKKTIRDQEQRIRNLNEQNSFISLIKNYWWLLLFLIGVGYFIDQIVKYLQ